MSNAKQLSTKQLLEILGIPAIKPGKQFAFYYGTTKDADGRKIYDKCVVATGDDETQARANAAAKLMGIVGHSGYHLGDRIPII